MAEWTDEDAAKKRSGTMEARRPMIVHEFAIPLALILFAVLVYLLLLGKLPGWTFAGSLVGLAVLVAVVAVVLPRSGDVSEIGAKASSQGVELLVKMQQIKEDVYAKAEAVRKMAEIVAEMSVFSMTRVGRLSAGGGHLQASLLEAREQLRNMLISVGSTSAKISEIIGPVSEIVAHDLASHAWREVQNVIRTSRPELVNSDELPKIGGRLIRVLKESQVGEAAASARSYLQGFGAWSGEIELRIADFEEFRRTGRLPRPRPGGLVSGGLQ